MNYSNNAQLYEMSAKNLNNKRGKWEVILHNDNHNTYDHVVNCLIEVCGQNYLQAVQCATLVHNTSKCSIIIDTWDECEDICTELHNHGLTVTISKFKKNV